MKKENPKGFSFFHPASARDFRMKSATNYGHEVSGVPS